MRDKLTRSKDSPLDKSRYDCEGWGGGFGSSSEGGQVVEWNQWRMNNKRNQIDAVHFIDLQIAAEDDGDIRHRIKSGGDEIILVTGQNSL